MPKGSLGHPEEEGTVSQGTQDPEPSNQGTWLCSQWDSCPHHPDGRGLGLSFTTWASSTYQRSLWGKGQQQATRSGCGATRFQLRWPAGSCRSSLWGRRKNTRSCRGSLPSAAATPGFPPPILGTLRPCGQPPPLPQAFLGTTGKKLPVALEPHLHSRWW